MSFQLHTEHLILRDFTLDDKVAYQAVTSHKKYQRFYSEDDCLPDSAFTLVEQFVSESKLTNRTSYNLAIVDKHSLTLIGVCGLRIQADLQASVGCGLNPHFQVAGLAHEAIRCLFDFAFNQLKLHRLYAETISQNKAAINLCKSLGMREEALFIESRYFKQTWWNTSVLAILKNEWHSTQNLPD